MSSAINNGPHPTARSTRATLKLEAALLIFPDIAANRISRARRYSWSRAPNGFQKKFPASPATGVVTPVVEMGGKKVVIEVPENGRAVFGLSSALRAECSKLLITRSLNCVRR